MRYLINEQILFDLAVEIEKQIRIDRINYIKDLANNRAIRIDTMKSHIEMMRDLRKFKKCGRARP